MNRFLSTSRVSLRLALYENEVARLPHTCHGVKVREGVAWMTVQGEDKILRAGEVASFEPGRFPAVVTALGGTQLILEVLGRERRREASLILERSPAYRRGAL
jgi:hypothetical protein